MRDSEVPITRLLGNYPWEYWPISLIREYNGWNFILDKSTNHLPYNPYEHILVVTDENWKIYHVGDTINATTSLNLYFSDGSVSTLWTGSSLKIRSMDFANPQDNLATRIKIILDAWSIFTKATALSESSEFEISSWDTTAAVRWTIFLVEKAWDSAKVSVIEWEVEVYKTENISPKIEVKSGENTSNATSTGVIYGTEKIRIGVLDKIKRKSENLPKGKVWVDDVLDWKAKDAQSCSVGYEKTQYLKKWEACVKMYVADYNEIWDLSMSGATKILVKSGAIDISEQNVGSTNWWTLPFDENKSFVDVNNTKWVFIDNVATDDFIKYENLGLTDDFVIEMSVQTSTLTTGW